MADSQTVYEILKATLMVKCKYTASYLLRPFRELVLLHNVLKVDVKGETASMGGPHFQPIDQAKHRSHAWRAW
jgi:hypothetical protein